MIRRRKLGVLALLTASLCLGALLEDPLARGRRGYSRGSVSRYQGSSRSYNRGSTRSYSRNYSTSSRSRYTQPSSNTYRKKNTTGGNRTSTQFNTNRSRSSSTSTRQGVSGQELGRDSGTASANRQTAQDRVTNPPQDGTRTHETQRGNTIETTTNTIGDTTYRDTSITSSSGQTASGSRTTEREGDKIKTESDWSSSRGGSYEGKGEVEFDDGRVEKVKWEEEGENRYGYEQERKFEAERKDGYWEYEREFKDSAGRDAKVEGKA